MKKINFLKLAIALYVALDWMGGASFGFMPFSPAAAAQTILVNTTLSAAVTASSATVVRVTSATGVTAPSTSDNTKATYLYVDRELMFVTSVNSTTVGVVRGAEGTVSSTHASGALVFVIPAYLSISQGGSGYGFGPGMPAGSCTRANEVALPRINYVSGVISDCIGGQWFNGDAAGTQRSVFGSTSVFGLRLPEPGATALTALETAGTAPSAATEEYCTELDLPFSMLLTGLAPLNGTTVGTDKHLVILRDASGNALANSATAGTTTANASTYQHLDFTAKYYAVGPARYFGCVQTNGTTDTLRHLITAVNNSVIAGKLTGQVFGTVTAAPTMPTTFTTALGPYFQLY